MCTNTEGSFECACDPGYQLNNDETTCEGIKLQSCYSILLPLHNYNVDVDECASDNGGCDQHCINTEGSFECSACERGYQLNTDGTTCEGG